MIFVAILSLIVILSSGVNTEEVDAKLPLESMPSKLFHEPEKVNDDVKSFVEYLEKVKLVLSKIKSVDFNDVITELKAMEQELVTAKVKFDTDGQFTPIKELVQKFNAQLSDVQLLILQRFIENLTKTILKAKSHMAVNDYVKGSAVKTPEVEPEFLEHKSHEEYKEDIKKLAEELKLDPEYFGDLVDETKEQPQFGAKQLVDEFVTRLLFPKAKSETAKKLVKEFYLNE